MDKQILYLGRTEQGVFAQALFGSSGAFEKVAGAPPFADWATGDELRKFIRTITKEDRKTGVYTLVNALGAGEFFGPNINSDYFPWDALAHEGDDYGYKTFLRAHAFQHHANKDPARAFGVPVHSILNTHMKRVELIIRLDRDQARAQGADGIITRVEKGEFPDVSMGCKVPFDVCSICGHRSKTRDDYCFPAGTQILTEGGQYQSIETLNVGDEVVTHTGQTKRITALLPSVAHDGLVKIESFGFSTIEATPSHPFFVARTRSGVHGGRYLQLMETSPDWMAAEDIQPNDTVFLPIPPLSDSVDAFPYDEKRGKEVGWLLGIYLAEGCPSFSKGTPYPKGVNFSLHFDETDIEDHIKQAVLHLDEGARVGISVDESRHSRTVRVMSRKAAEWLMLHGGRGSKTKLLSPAMAGGPKFISLQMLKGWAEGDGSYDAKMDLLRVATSSETLARQMQLVAAGCGILAGVKLHSRDTNFGHQDIWYVSFSGDAAHAVQEARPQDVFSKQSKLFFWKNYLCSTVKKVENLDFHGPVYNFEVEDDHSYVAGSYAVHNCQHMRPPEELRGIYGPNKILPDGRKIYVINLTPRFFDISFVFIGADKTAKVMAKLASRGDHVCMGNVCALPSENGGEGAVVYGPTGTPANLGEIRKTASACDEMRGPCGRKCAECAERESCHTDKLAAAFGVKKQAAKKVAEIIKSVPTGVFALKTLPHLEGAEPDIDRCDLDEMAERPLREAFSGAARLGIVLKPHEFQHLTLRRMGEDALLQDLNEHHKIFRPSREFADVGMDSKLDDVFDLLKKYIHQRTALGTPFVMRVVMSGGGAKNALPTREPIEHSLLDKVSAAYNGYRRNLLMKLSQSVEGIHSDPRLREVFLKDELSNMFNKTSSSSIMSPDSMQYFLGAHFSDRNVLCESATVGSVAFNDEWLHGMDHTLA
jgi:hypothetical protein